MLALYKYPVFPRLNPELFTAARYVAPLGNASHTAVRREVKMNK